MEYTKQIISQVKIDNGNDIIIVAITEENHFDYGKQEIIIGFNGLEYLNCEVNKFSDIHFQPTKLTMWNNNTKYISMDSLMQIVKLMNNGMLNRTQYKELVKLITLDYIKID